ncbi:MAG: hypothetical protein GTO40_31065 [Deltaproteobacteria bacterium]|nr:hypothetical protein [Deltaproteobacteria bacterium]
MVATVLFWIGHRVSSAYLAYCTTAYRPLLRTQRIRFIWVPIGIAVTTFAVLLPGDDALPWSWADRLMFLVILDYGLITYHFASQHFGVLSLYRVRAGRETSRGGRRLDRIYALGVGGVMIFVAELGAGTVFFQDRWINPLIDPKWLESVYGELQLTGTVLVVLFTGWMLFREAVARRPSVPRTLYLVGMALMVVAAFYLNPFIFVAIWTTQHWLVAIGLTTRVAKDDPPAGPSLWYRTWHRVNRRPVMPVLLLMAISAIMLPVMEVEALHETGAGYAERIVPLVAKWLANESWLSVLVAFGFTTAFLHYALDRAVFRLSNSAVREAARGLFR